MMRHIFTLMALMAFGLLANAQSLTLVNISGMAFRQNGVPYPGLTVTASVANGPTAQAVSDPLGYFYMDVPVINPSDSVAITWADCNGSIGRQDFYYSPANMQIYTRIATCATQPLAGNITVTGNVANPTNAPHQGSFTIMLQNGEGMHVSAVTDSQGNYSATMPYYDPNGGQLDVRLTNCNGNYITNSYTYNANAQAFISNFDYCVGLYSRFILVSGRIVDNSPHPLPGLFASISDDQGLVQQIVTDSLGNYSIYVGANAGSGQFTLTYFDCNFRSSSIFLPYSTSDTAILQNIRTCPDPLPVHGRFVSTNPTTSPVLANLEYEVSIFAGVYQYGTLATTDSLGFISFEANVTASASDSAVVSFWDCAGQRRQVTAYYSAATNSFELGDILWCSPADSRAIRVVGHVNNQSVWTFGEANFPLTVSYPGGRTVNLVTDSVGNYSFMAPVLVPSGNFNIQYSACTGSTLTETAVFPYTEVTSFLTADLTICSTGIAVLAPLCVYFDSTQVPCTIYAFNVDTTGSFVVTDSAVIGQAGRFCFNGLDANNIFQLFVVSGNGTYLPGYFNLVGGNIFLDPMWQNGSTMSPNLSGSTMQYTAHQHAPMNGNGNISGTVTRLRTPLNLEYAYAVLYDVSGIVAQPIATMQLDANGHYDFANVPNGSYEIMISALGHSSLSHSFMNYTGGNINANFSVQGRNIVPTAVSGLVGTAEGKSLQVFPNPTSTLVNIKGLEIGEQISVTDILGKQVLSGTVLSETESLNVSALPAGLYFINAASARPSKFVKQ